MEHEKAERINEVRFCPHAQQCSLTPVEVVFELYNRVAKLHKTYTEIEYEIENQRKQTCFSRGIDGSRVLAQSYRIGKIGDVEFESEVTPEYINVRHYEDKYGGVKMLINKLWQEKVRKTVSLKLQNDRSKESTREGGRREMTNVMKALTTMLATVMAMSAIAGTANTVKVTKFHQSYPYSGKAKIEYTVGGTLPGNAVAEIVLNTDDMIATFIQSNIVTGANSHVIDFASSFGGAMLLTNASFVVTIAQAKPGSAATGLGGVQLWENGPYWAECNVGASKPEEYGYYFWWGDTVGCYITESGWVSVNDGTSRSFGYYYGTAVSTMNKANSALLSEGYIDSSGNLVATHDAATAHLGSPWRMPTDAEFSALINNCRATWITTNGVSGRLITGRGDYANSSIFLPASGCGYGSGLGSPNLNGYYWSSAPNSTLSDISLLLYFDSGYFIRNYFSRDYGCPVRPVRGVAQ